jgi:hypothetical protein
MRILFKLERLRPTIAAACAVVNSVLISVILSPSPSWNFYRRYSSAAHLTALSPPAPNSDISIFLVAASQPGLKSAIRSGGKAASPIRWRRYLSSRSQWSVGFLDRPTRTLYSKPVMHTIFSWRWASATRFSLFMARLLASRVFYRIPALHTISCLRDMDGFTELRAASLNRDLDSASRLTTDPHRRHYPAHRLAAKTALRAQCAPGKC